MADVLSSQIRKILDSRGNQTVEVDISLEEGSGTSAAPSGASTGIHEVVSFPEGGIDASLDIFEKEITSQIVGMDGLDQATFDKWLHEIDGTDNFSRIGGSVAIAASLALARAAADANNTPLWRYLAGIMPKSLPRPMGNVIGGGAHGVGGTDIQEFLTIALGPTVRESVFANSAVHKLVKEKLIERYPDHTIGKGDEGAWLASIGNEEALEILVESCDEISRTVGFDCKPCLDMAASEMYKDGMYRYREGSISPDGQVDFVADLVESFGLYSVEDPLQEDDFEGFARMTEAIGEKCLVVGDDLFVTNIERLRKGVQIKAANAILIKPNQIGTVTDTMQTVDLARKSNYQLIISHRSGETTDDSIAHLGVAFGCFGIKTGVVGGERTAKLNELIRIEESIEAGDS
ncbi:MAG: phosphopyruvate hydratase [Methanobacteriota archaeon]|nr:MAG: phosphopyruvate hydratase [Euryarchaeota archaeon]